MQLRLLDSGDLPPARNMALDEALLISSREPVLRIYGWQPDAVSLGYFQQVEEFADVAATTTLVRRLTGGGAIHHDREVTFALAVDADQLPPVVSDSYALLHDAIVRALAAVGVTALRLEHGHAQAPRSRERWCFADPSLNDIVDAAGRKLVGSAQRRIRAGNGRHRVLHHGSIAMHKPRWTPEVAAVADQADFATDRQPLTAAIAREIAAALELTPAADQPRYEEATLATRLQRERYESPDFLSRR